MPPSKRQKLTCFIHKLPDALLAQIFSHLPTKERFQVSTVCKKWLGASMIPWTDVKRLDLVQIPSDKISPVLSLCSGVNEVVAKDRKIILDENLTSSAISQVQTLKLYHVCFSVSDSGSPNRIARKYERLLNDFFKKFPNLQELIWHNIISADADENRITGKLNLCDKAYASKYRAWFPTSFGHSLRRLQLSVGPDFFADADNAFVALSQMEQLECLYLGGDGDGFLATLSSSEETVDCLDDKFFAALGKMSNLRELCLANAGIWFGLPVIGGSDFMLHTLAAIACEKLLKLEVLIFASSFYIEPEGIGQMITSHPTLKILALAGEDLRLSGDYDEHPNFVPRILPGRTLLSPIDQRPLPCLRVFIGGVISQHVQFTLPQPLSAEFTEIDCPLPQFLAKPGVAEVFKDVWIAKAICEGASNGVEPWGSPNCQRDFYSKNSLLFCGEH